MSIDRRNSIRQARVFPLDTKEQSRIRTKHPTFGKILQEIYLSESQAWSPTPHSACFALMISTTRIENQHLDRNIQRKRNETKGRLTSRLQTGASDQKTINVRLLRQLATILLVDTAPVNDPRLLRRLARHVLPDPLTDLGVYLLRLLRGGHFARADGPDGFVRDDQLVPAGFGYGRVEGRQLVNHDFHRLVGFALLQRFTAAEDDAEAAFERGFGFAGDEL